MPIQINLECHDRPECKLKQKPGWQLRFLTRVVYLVSNWCMAPFFQLAEALGYAGTYFQACCSSEFCLCLDQNLSLGSQNKICQVILAEGQTDWTKFLPDTMHLTSVESHSDSSLFCTFKRKIRRGFKVGGLRHFFCCLSEIVTILAWWQQEIISTEDSLLDLIFRQSLSLSIHNQGQWPCVDTDLPGTGKRDGLPTNFLLPPLSDSVTTPPVLPQGPAGDTGPLLHGEPGPQAVLVTGSCLALG